MKKFNENSDNTGTIFVPSGNETYLKKVLLEAFASECKNFNAQALQYLGELEIGGKPYQAFAIFCKYARVERRAFFRLKNNLKGYIKPNWEYEHNHKNYQNHIGNWCW
jgi:hypothetical protein